MEVKLKIKKIKYIYIYIYSGTSTYEFNSFCDDHCISKNLNIKVNNGNNINAFQEPKIFF